MDADELADLIRRAQAREPAAFDALVDRYSSRLYGYLYRLVGSRDDAEDLLQELFVRVVKMIGRYEHDGRFDAWLFRIATNLVRDRVRRVRTAPTTLSGEIDNERLRDVPADGAAADPSRGMAAAEDIDKLQWALGRLSDAEREVVMLRHFSELSFKDIAAMMGTPLGTALARAHRGLARLRQLMTEPEERRCEESELGLGSATVDLRRAARPSSP
jgi:RNA polymerase sigma-70 factor (ECF subfamily)